METNARVKALPGTIPAWSFADRLRKARRDYSKHTQQQMADALGVGIKAYSAWESGHNNPSDIADIAVKLESITGITKTWFLGWEDDEKAPTPKGGGQSGRNLKFLVAPRVGLEPTTCRYQADTAEVIPFPAREAAVDAGDDAPLAPVTVLFGGAA